MRREHIRSRTAAAGFTLLEALVAVALMGIIMGVLATVTAQWLPNWNRGLLRVQRNEQIATALDRLSLDLGAAEFVSPREPGQWLFTGDATSIVFVRSALGPNDRGGLEYVRLSEAADSLGGALVRARAPFVPLAGDNATLMRRIAFADPVVLLRDPYRVVFAYAGLDGVWKNSWQGSPPSAIRLNVVDNITESVLPVSTAVRPHVTLAAPAPQQTQAELSSTSSQPAPAAEGGGGQ